MDNTANTIQNSALTSLMASAPKGVVSAIQKASAHTGVNFAYLVQQAGVESSFNPKIKAKTSSASGLYQFIESTWLNMVKKHGDKYGMGELADKISDNGKVSSKALKKEILALRNDPEKASAMAAEFARENEKSLNENWGGKVGSTELYLAHFMGAGQAAAFLKAHDENPLQQAAYMFPDAAKANRNVFFDTKTGRAKTMDEVYAFFDKKFDMKDVGDASTMVANAQPCELTPQSPQQQVIASNVFVGGANNNGGFYYDPAYSTSWQAPASSSYGSLAAQHLASNPADIMLMAQMDNPLDSGNGGGRHHSFKLND